MPMLPGLAFVPPELVEWSFPRQLVIAFPENAHPLCRYFEENYIGHLNMNGERNTSLYPISFGTISIWFHKGCREQPI